MCKWETHRVPPETKIYRPLSNTANREFSLPKEEPLHWLPWDNQVLSLGIKNIQETLNELSRLCSYIYVHMCMCVYMHTEGKRGQHFEREKGGTWKGLKGRNDVIIF